MITRRHLAGLAGAMALATVAAVTPATAAAAAAATSDPAYAGAITVTTPASGPFTISDDHHRAGPVRFHFISRSPETQHGGGSDVELFGLRNGVSIVDVENHIRAQFEPPKTAGAAKAAASTRWLVANTRVYGGGAIQGVGSANVTVFLPAGPVYLLDVGAVFSGAKTVPVKVFHVCGTVAQRLLPPIAGTIDVTSADRFHVTSTYPAQGNYLIRNVSDTIHFVSFSPVKAGTTDADITKGVNAINAGKQPSDPYLHTKTAVQAGVMSPGQQQVFGSSLLTPGTYDLECYIADDMTGMPHFFMGMHKIIFIK